MDTQKDSIKKKKEEIRKEIIRRLGAQDPSLRQERSLKIQKKLLSLEEFRVAKTVMTYVSLPTEVNTEYINKQALKLGKQVAIPYIEPENQTIIASKFTAIEHLEKGPFGIYQIKQGLLNIVPLKEIDLIVVPAIAFSPKGARLGRGKGCYDKFLANKDLFSSKTIGLAFSFQMTNDLPFDFHDKPVFRVITD